MAASAIATRYKLFSVTLSWYTQWWVVVKRRRHEETEWKRNTDNRKPEVRYRSDTSVDERKVAVLILQWVPLRTTER